MKILNVHDVSNMTSFSITQIKRLELEGKFPRSILLSDRRSGWLEEDVQAWIKNCIRRSCKKV